MVSVRAKALYRRVLSKHTRGFRNAVSWLWRQKMANVWACMCSDMYIDEITGNPVATDRSTPSGKRGERVIYPVIDRSAQSGKVGATVQSPTSVRINALKDTAERIRSTLKKHSDEHAEAKHVLSQATVISPQRSVQNAGPSCLLHPLSVSEAAEHRQCVVEAVY